ncbi:tellurite resistance protein TehB [Cognatishimia activa]|uniref:Tellurite resistance protein TehB n=1 Tax=Cognatishimia activa TaxID=1715691 RepID=A0A0P1IV41_9RHOB|nr:DUF1971 domain-containing protein [Cognatishimia activa]CUK27514.1 tellurite resistance protein TehB [Cognatishimia activa]
MTTDFPAGLVKYSQSPVFTESTVPAALLKDHSTKPSVWGKLIVTKGTLIYQRVDKTAQFLKTGDAATIFPEELHHVTPQGEVEFQVEFYKPAAEGGAS